MNQYDVILVIFSLVAFVISVSKVTGGITRAISRLESSVEQLGSALSELKSTIASFKEGNAKTHAEIFERLEKLECRVVRLETREERCCEI